MIPRLVLFLILSASAVLPVLGGIHEQPNVILIVTDDQGYGDMSCHGNPVLKTSNLDRLHDQRVFDTLPIGRSYPIVQSRVEIQGRIESKNIGVDDKEAVFTLLLKKGETELRAFFSVENALSINTYYVFVKLVGLEK